jgi:lipid-binding SYLF domain-containing protein
VIVEVFMQNFSTRAPWFAAALAALFLTSPVLAADNKDEIDRVSRSIEVLQQLMAAPDDAIPEYILERAEAIVVIPTLVKEGSCSVPSTVRAS